MQDYRKLKVWQDAHVLVKEVYRATAAFPKDERYGLSAQIRKAAVSIGANIAEGAGRRTPADFGRFLDISAGSANEVEYYLLLVADLGWIPTGHRDSLSGQVSEVRSEIVGLRKALEPSGR